MAWLDERNAKMMPTKAQERPRALNMAKSLREMARLVKFHWSYIHTAASSAGAPAALILVVLLKLSLILVT